MENECIRLRMCELFKTLNISQSEVAKRLNTSQSAINAMSNGKRPITMSTIAKLINQFGVSGEWLMTGEGEMLRPQYIEQHFEGNVSGGQNIYGPINGNKNSFSYTDIKGKTIPATGPSPISPDKFFDELAAQRRMTEKAQQQIDRLLDIIEKMNTTK